MMKRLHIILTLLLALSPAWGARMYKWTDEEGNVHYSDKLPPDVVEKEHKELNTQGLTTRSVNREKTQAERMEEDAAAAAAESERKRTAELEARQRARDELLLNTFTTERDLLLTRDDRLEAVDSIINLTTNNNANLEQQAADTRKRIESLQKANKEIPENLSKQLANLEGQLTKNMGFIEIKREERRKLEQQFDADLKRYRELKGISADTPAEQQAAEKAAQAAIGTEIKSPAPPKPAPGKAPKPKP
jgi:hypothetical protein